MTTEAAVIESGGQRARVRPWSGGGGSAYLVPLAPGVPLTTDFVERCVDVLAAAGFTSVVTPALSPSEQRPFLARGFREQERLHLLARDLDHLPAPPLQRGLAGLGAVGGGRGAPGGWGSPVPARGGAPRPSLRGAGPADAPTVLEIDAAAFPPFWRLDRQGLDEALAATPKTRFRVAVDDTAGRVVGYAISGRAGRNGYLQRLAVHPEHRRAGLGKTLVADGLRWMRRRGARAVVVNTQVGNEAALRLYRSLGFRLQPGALAVLRRDLVP